MGEFDLFNFLYALSSFCVGGAAMLGTFLALVSIFPVQKIDDNEKLLGQRLNELLTISFRTVDSYDELVEVRSQLMNVAKSYKQIFDEWGFPKESYHNLINMAQNITVAIQSLVIIAISCFIVAVSKATDLLFLALLSAAFLIGIEIKFKRKYNRHSFFYKITAIRQRFLKNVFFQRDQIQYPLPEKLFYPCYFKNIKLRNQLPSSGEKLDIISIRAFSQVTFIKIHGNKEKVAGDSQLVGLSNICYTVLDEIIECIFWRFPSKRSHWEAVIISIIISFELYSEIFKREETMRGIKAFVILAMTAFYFPVVPWGKRTNLFVLDA